MNRLGWDIESVPLSKSEWVRGIKTKYVLRSKPLEVEQGQDWYEVLKGKPRGHRSVSEDMARIEKEKADAAPLFVREAP
jgi:hypothetical protein